MILYFQRHSKTNCADSVSGCTTYGVATPTLHLCMLVFTGVHCAVPGYSQLTRVGGDILYSVMLPQSATTQHKTLSTKHEAVHVHSPAGQQHNEGTNQWPHAATWFFCYCIVINTVTEEPYIYAFSIKNDSFVHFTTPEKRTHHSTLVSGIEGFHCIHMHTVLQLTMPRLTFSVGRRQMIFMWHFVLRLVRAWYMGVKEER